MGINGISAGYYPTGYVDKKKTAEMPNGAEKTAYAKELSEAEEMAVFKKEFYADLEKLGVDRTIANAAINISEQAFQNMKDDPEYREKVLSVIKRDLSASVAPAPDCSLLITVGATLKDYRADAWPVNNDSEFFARSQDSFYKKTNGSKKEKQKDLLEEYLEKRAQVKKQQREILNEKIVKQKRERNRLLNNGIDFNGVLFAKATENAAKTEQSFKDMWQARFPGAYYHVMDGTKISQGAWNRNDFPVEKFFQNDTDDSVLNWTPTGAEPAATSSQVQSRWNSTLGQKSVIVPPALEEKMKNDPELAKRVMANVENFIATYFATSVRPGRICSWLISLDENGEIEKYRVTGGGGISGPTEAEMRQFEAEQAAKRKRRARYMQILEESAFARSEEQERLRQAYYQNNLVNKAIEKYERLFW